MAEQKTFFKREICLFCDSPLDDSQKYFEKDLEIPIAVYCVDKSKWDRVGEGDREMGDREKGEWIPYNISICNTCSTPQTLYLGDLNEVYKINHADSTGSIMKNMHYEFMEMIKNYKGEITNFLEIGSSKGELADLILSSNEFNNKDYYIIEPNFFGVPDGKKILLGFYEDIDDKVIPANTLIISHVFEHFYRPMEILNKIANNHNIEHIFLAFPDLQYYVHNNVLHVLNTEHTYYVENSFLVDLFASKGFVLKDPLKFYKGHTVFMHFSYSKESKESKGCLLLGDTVKHRNRDNVINSIDKYFSDIKSSVNLFNKFLDKSDSKYNYIFPCSIHSIFLLTFGLDLKKLSGMLDNSPNKIGKTVYGTDLLCHSFKKIVENVQDDVSIILNGGVFNAEVMESIKKNPRIKVFF